MSDIKLTQKDKVPIKKVVYAQPARQKVENKVHQTEEQIQFITKTMASKVFLICVKNLKNEEKER